MRIATIAQGREIDRLTQAQYNLSGEALMESAGALSAREIEKSFSRELKRGFTSIVCGPGNNGADGLVVARHLHSNGHKNLVVFLAAEGKSQSALFKNQHERAKLQGLKIDSTRTAEELARLKSSSLVIDAIFGLGFRGELNRSDSELVKTINSLEVPVVSLDLPSGLDADRGTVKTVAITAAMTLTFELAKPGFFVNEGPRKVGRLRVLSVGFPRELLRAIATTHSAFSGRFVHRHLPAREETSNKSSHGRVVVFAGQPGMWGAAILSSGAAYRMGAGYVVLASHSDSTEVVKNLPEVLTARADDQKFWETKKWSAAAVGPGLGVSQKTAEVITRLKGEKLSSVVLDADAITTCVEFNLFPLPKTWILTPHAGELSRVLGVDSKVIESDRFRYAAEGAAVTGCNVLLKGFRSVLATAHKTTVILSGNSALAKAGTGDVLTGMIGGLLAQGVAPDRAAAIAAYIHGRLADEWVRSGNDKRSLLASDLKASLPQLLADLSRGRVR